MAIRSLAAAVALLLASPAAAGPVRTDDVDVQSYRVRMELDVEAGRYQATMQLALERDASSASLELDAAELEVSSVSVGDTVLSFEQGDRRLRVDLPPSLATQVRLELTIAWSGGLSRGLKGGEGALWTRFHTASWMPCRERVADVATFEVELVTDPGAVTAAPGTPSPPVPTPDGRAAHRWTLDRPTPAYLLGFAAGRFTEEVLADGPPTMRLLTAPGVEQCDARGFATTEPALRYLERLTGLPYDQPQYTQVLVPGRAAQELSGMAVIGDRVCAIALTREQDAWFVIHELAHQWFGGRTTIADWAHNWLNEGVATFLTGAFGEAHWGRAEYDVELDRAKARVARERERGEDRALVVTDWDDPGETGGTITYSKGALVLGVLRADLGDEAFFGGLRRFAAIDGARPVTTSDLRGAFEAASGRELGGFFDRWVFDGSADITAMWPPAE